MGNPIVGALEIIGIRDAGNLDRERLLLRVLEPVKLENYVVVNVKSTNGDKLTILNDKVFWFPSVLANPGEFIRLYTKSGSYKKDTGKYGESPTVFHDFYWKLTVPVWDSVKSNAITIFKVNTWNTAYLT